MAPFEPTNFHQPKRSTPHSCTQRPSKKYYSIGKTKHYVLLPPLQGDIAHTSTSPYGHYSASTEYQSPQPAHLTSDTEASESSPPHESPPKLPTPDSDVADANPLSSSENFSSYSQLILHIAKVMDLGIQQPIPNESDKAYEDIDQDQTSPLHALLHLCFLLTAALMSGPKQIQSLAETFCHLYFPDVPPLLSQHANHPIECIHRDHRE